MHQCQSKSHDIKADVNGPLSNHVMFMNVTVSNVIRRSIMLFVLLHHLAHASDYLATSLVFRFVMFPDRRHIWIDTAFLLRQTAHSVHNGPRGRVCGVSIPRQQVSVYRALCGRERVKWSRQGTVRLLFLKPASHYKLIRRSWPTHRLPTLPTI